MILYLALHYFNSRPRAGGDMAYGIKRDTTTISIHAPARGATGWPGLLLLHRLISIHAPARGAT